jgi:hypothetical protein
MYGGVRGRRLITASYSIIKRKEGSLPPRREGADFKWKRNTRISVRVISCISIENNRF